MGINVSRIKEGNLMPLAEQGDARVTEQGSSKYALPLLHHHAIMASTGGFFCRESDSTWHQPQYKP
jgi:hypothetical protein